MVTTRLFSSLSAACVCSTNRNRHGDSEETNALSYAGRGERATIKSRRSPPVEYMRLKKKKPFSPQRKRFSAVSTGNRQLSGPPGPSPTGNNNKKNISYRVAADGSKVPHSVRTVGGVERWTRRGDEQ